MQQYHLFFHEKKIGSDKMVLIMPAKASKEEEATIKIVFVP